MPNSLIIVVLILAGLALAFRLGKGDALKSAVIFVSGVVVFCFLYVTIIALL